MKPVIACLLTVLVLAGISGAQEQERDLVGEFLNAKDPKARIDLRQELLANDADPVAVAARLAEGRAYSGEVDRGWLERTNLCSDGVERPYLLFVPEDYDPAKRYRLVVDMHGGISGPAHLSHAELERMKFFWGSHAEDHGYFLALPTGQTGAVWWDEVGSHNVLTMIGRIKREYNIDENLVFATGFSDGGSGSYYLALTWPTPFAGFIPLNGHPVVAGVGGLQIHLRNFWNKPMFAVNTENDSLYPSVAVKPIMDMLREIGAPVVWHDIAGFTHNPMYLPEERPAIWKWAQETVREPHPAKVFWEGAADAPHRVHWLNVTKVRETAAGTPFDDLNPLLPNRRMIIGVNLDRAFEGPGVKISSIIDGSPAAAAGVLAGDVITGFDGAPTADFGALRTAISAKKPEDAFTVTVKRGEEELKLAGQFPKLVPTPAFKRTKLFGSIEATATGNHFDLRCDNIHAFDLYLSPDIVDFEKPVKVTVNGDTVHEAVVKPDLAFLTTMALADDDRTMLYLARLSIAVPGAVESPAEESNGPPADNRMRADHAPTPFSAEQIRNACPDGRVSTFLLNVPGRGPFHQEFRFKGGDETTAVLEVAMTDIEGVEIQPARESRIAWSQLQSHASYPAEGTTITTGSIETPAGTFDCWIYTTRKGPVTAKFWFAKSLPGPPVLLIQTQDEEEIMRMTLVKHTD